MKDLGYFHANADRDMSTTVICYFSLLMAHYVCFWLSGAGDLVSVGGCGRTWIAMSSVVHVMV